MLRIGELARIGGVSVKALRFYDEIGLLVPAGIDESTGYRRYASAQITRLRSILALKDLGLALPAIARVLAHPESFGESLAEHRERLVHEAASARSRIARLDALLAGGTPDVIVRETAPLTGAAVRERLTRYEDLADAIALGARHVPRDVRRAALWHRCEDDDVDGEVLFVGAIDVRAPLRPIAIPRQRVATAVYAGNDWTTSYAAIYAWMEANGFELAGAKREEFLTDEITEVLIPIRKRANA